MKDTPFRRTRPRRFAFALTGLLLPGQVFASAMPTLSLIPDNQHVLNFPHPIHTADVADEHVASIKVDGNRLIINASNPGSTSIEFVLAGETASRTLGLNVSGTGVLGQPVALPHTQAPPQLQNIPLQGLPADATPHQEAPSPDAKTRIKAQQDLRPHPVRDDSQMESDIARTDVALVRALPPRTQIPPSAEVFPRQASSVSSALEQMNSPADPALDNRKAQDPSMRFTEDEDQAASSVSADVAAQSQAFSLLDAVNLGLSINPEVRAAIAEVERANSEIDIAKSGYHPSLEMSAGPETGSSGQVGYNLTVSQMLYDWGKVEKNVDSASASMRNKSEELLLVRDDVALDIVETYLDVQAGRERLAVIVDHYQRLEKLQDTIRERGSNGYADAAEGSRAALSLAQANEQLAIERGQLQDAQRQYRILIGETPEELTTPLEAVLPVELNDDGRLDDVIRRAPIYRKAQEDVLVAEAQVGGARAALRPQLLLEGSTMRREIGGAMTDDSVVALRLRMDITHGLSSFYRVDSELQRLEAARWTLDNMERDLRRKLASLSETAAVLRWREKALDIQRSQARDVQSLYKEQFIVGMRDITDLLTIETELFEAERQMINTRSERQRTQYRTAAQVGLLVPWLEGRLAEGRQI